MGMGADLWSIEGLLVQWSQMREVRGKVCSPVLGEEVAHRGAIY